MSLCQHTIRGTPEERILLLPLQIQVLHSVKEAQEGLVITFRFVLYWSIAHVVFGGRDIGRQLRQNFEENARLHSLGPPSITFTFSIFNSWASFSFSIHIFHFCALPPL